MIMRAKQDGEVWVVSLEGHLDFESTQNFQRTCFDLADRKNADKLVLNFEKLKFVGSSGIGQFIKILKDFNKKKKTRTKLCALSAEFARMFRAAQTARKPFDVYGSEEEAIASFFASSKRRKPLDC